MARIRTVKPEYWTDERVGECSPSARLLFIAAWNFADDAGGLERSAKQLKAQAFPYDQLDCEPLIQELLKVGLLIEYESCGKKYLHIKGFRTHQKIEKPAKPRYPVYESSLRTQLLLPDKSVSSAVSSLGREGNGSIRPPHKPPRLEDKSKTDPTPQPVVLPPELAIDSWTEWVEFRRVKHWPMTPQTLRQHVKLLARYSPTIQREIVEASIGSDWQGLFPPKGRPSLDPDPFANWQPPPDTDNDPH